MTASTLKIWTVLVGLGVGTFLLRFVFLGMLGDRTLPDWVLRHLRYTPVAVLPALIAPLVIWPSGTNGETDPARLLAAVVTVLVGWRTRHVALAIVSGAATLYLGLWLIG